MPGLLKMLGLPDMPMLSVFLLLTMIVLGAMLLGAFAGAWLWNRYGIPTRFPAEAVRAGIATGSGLLLLITLAVIRP